MKIGEASRPKAVGEIDPRAGVVTDSVHEHDGRIHPFPTRTRGAQWRIPVTVIVSEVLAIARHGAGHGAQFMPCVHRGCNDVE
jgi:hypothetical protein